MKKFAFILILPLFLFACSSAQNEVASLKVALTAAEIGGKAYIELPLCETTESLVCSKADISAKIKQADQAAFDAVMEAGKIVNDPNASDDAVSVAVNGARIAIAGLTSLVPIFGGN